MPDDTEMHPAVALLLARMDSHPEEFRLKDPSYHDRWYNHMSAINSYGNEADTAALNAKVRDIRMAEIHEQIMDEMLNGEDRRRKHAEDTEYERNLMKSQLVQQQLRVGTLSGDMNPIGYASGGGASLPVSTSPYSGVTGTKASSIMIDDQVLDASMIKRMKRMMSGRSK